MSKSGNVRKSASGNVINSAFGNVKNSASGVGTNSAIGKSENVDLTNNFVAFRPRCSICAHCLGYEPHFWR